MDPSDNIMLPIIILLVALSALTSAVETAITASSKAKLLSMLDDESVKKKSKVKRAIDLKENQTRNISSILVGNNIINLSASAMMTFYVSKIFGNYFIALGTGILTLVILIFGEVAPKNVAVHIPENVLITLSGPTKIVVTILYPIAVIVQKLAGLVARLFGIDVSNDIETYTEEELKTMVDLSHAGGLIEEEEKEMIHNVFELDERTARDVMVPRIDMVSVSLDATYEEVNEIFRKEQFTRLPVYEESIDNIVGILNVKDLLLLEDNERHNFEIKNIIRKAVYVYEKKKVLEILESLKEERANIAIVLDEYGATAGMVTLEDVIEEIVGDINDEYDLTEDEAIKKISENEFIIEGSANITDVYEATGIDLATDEVESIGGVILSKTDDIPKRGQAVLLDNCKLQVLEMDGNRISKIKLTKFETEVDENNEKIA